MIALAVVLIAILIGVNVICSVMQKSTNYDDDIRMLKRIKGIGSTVIIVILILAIIFSGIKIVDQTEVGVVKRLGKITRTIDGGVNFVNPFTDTVQMYDLKVKVSNRTFASYSKDAQPMTANIEYQYNLNPESAMTIAKEYGNYSALEEKLGNVVEEKIKVVLARYSAMSLLEDRSNISPMLLAEVQKLQEVFPVHFTSVILQDIDFSDAFEASVEAKMKAEQEALKAEQEANKAIIEANRDKEVAEIEAEAAIAQARGEAEALNIKREALQNMPQTYIAELYLEKWNGELPTYITGNGSGLMIAPNMQ